MQNWPAKDPAETVLLSIDWTGELDGDSISTVVWTVPSGLTKVTQSHAAGIATVKVSGGTAGQTYEIECVMTGSASGPFKQTNSLRCLSL